MLTASETRTPTCSGRSGVEEATQGGKDIVAKLHPVSMVLGGLVAYPIEQAAPLLQAYRDFATNAPDNLSTTVMFLSVPPAPMFPAHLHGQRVAAIALCYAGPLDKGQELVGPLHTPSVHPCSI